MKTVPVYVIRHEPTGHYLPGTAHGLTRPSDVVPVDPTEQAPRVWPTRLAAHKALTQWLRGTYKTHYRYADLDRTHDEIVVERVDPPTPRRRGDMVVEEVELHLR